MYSQVIIRQRALHSALFGRRWLSFQASALVSPLHDTLSNEFAEYFFEILLFFGKTVSKMWMIIVGKNYSINVYVLRSRIIVFQVKLKLLC